MNRSQMIRQMAEDYFLELTALTDEELQAQYDNLKGKKVELLGTYLESQAFKDALEKGVAEYVSTIEQPMLYLEVAFTAEATAAKALIDAWLKDNLAEIKK